MEIQIAEGINSILIIEDEGLIAMMMEDMARQMGVTDVHVCAELEAALYLAANTHIDCAVLDVRVRGGETGPVADILAERDVPFMFATGDGAEALPERHRYRPMISKPFAEDDFKTMLLDAFRDVHRPSYRPSERVATPSLTD